MDRLGPRFVKTFGQMLLPEGFFLWNGSFYRLDPEAGLVWIVTLDRCAEDLPVLSCEVKAFCHGLDETSLHSAMYHVMGLRGLCRDRIDRARLGVDRLYPIEVDGMVFRACMLDRFAGIRSLEDFQEFRSWHYRLTGGAPGGEYWLPQEMWECVQLGQYDRARQLNRLLTDRWTEICREQPEVLDRPHVRAKNDALLALRDLFEAGSDAALQNRLEENLARSREVIRSYFQREDIV